MDTMSNDKPLPDDINDYPPAAFGAGAPAQSYAKYTKLRSGAFGVRVPGGAKPGMFVDVRTNAGDIRRERIHHVLWTGADKYTGELIALCTVEGAVIPRRQQPQQAQSSNEAPRSRAAIMARPTANAPAQPRRAKRQPLPRLVDEDEREATSGESYAQERAARNDATTKRLDDERAAAEAALNLPEPEF